MILTDDVLAGKSGSELAQQVLAIRPRLPVLVMGGKLPEASGRSALKIGVRARLHKPLALQELTERLADLFVARAARRGRQSLIFSAANRSCWIAA